MTPETASPQDNPAHEKEAPTPGGDTPRQPGARMFAVGVSLLVFVAGATLMALEMAGGKVLAASFGSDLYVWGALLGVFLYAMSAGYVLGGRVADRAPHPGVLCAACAAGGALVMALPLVSASVCRFIQQSAVFGPKSGPLAASVVLYFVPVLLLSITSPFVIRLLARGVEGLGVLSGRIFALSTGGSILGVLGATYGLIPFLPLSRILVIIGAVAVLCAAAGIILTRRGTGGAQAAEESAPPKETPANQPSASNADPLDGIAPARAGFGPVAVLVVLYGAGLMGLEMSGARLLASYFGSDVFVWGAVIGVFMAAMSAGYVLGGRTAKRVTSIAPLAAVPAVAGVLIIMTPWMTRRVCVALLHATEGSVMIPPLVASLILFGPPTVLFGMAPPWAVRLLARDARRAGDISGRVYALSTAGSVAGLLLFTFVLVPSLTIATVLLVLGSVLLAASFVALLLLPAPSHLRLGFGALAALAVFGGWRGTPPSSSNVDLENAAARVKYKASKEKYLKKVPQQQREDEARDYPPFRPWRVRAEIPSAYTNVFVVERKIEGETHRFLQFDVYRESGIYAETPPFRRSHWAAYTDMFHLALLFNPRIRSALFIGGGGGIGPRAFRRLYPKMRIEVVDIDPAVKHIAENYFHYRDDKRMTWRTADGRAFLLQRPERRWDVIFLDAFTAGGRLPGHLMTREFLELVRSRLTKTGVALSNLNSAVLGPVGRVYRAERKTFETVFDESAVYSFPRNWYKGGQFEPYHDEDGKLHTKEEQRKEAQEGNQNLFLAAAPALSRRLSVEGLRARFREFYAGPSRELLKVGSDERWGLDRQVVADVGGLAPRDLEALVGSERTRFYEETETRFVLVPEINVMREHVEKLYEEPVDLSDVPVLTDDYCPTDTMFVDIAKNWRHAGQLED